MTETENSSNRRNQWIGIIAAVIVAAIIIGVCASAVEDATDFSCRSTLRCDDEGNCTYVTDCD